MISLKKPAAVILVSVLAVIPILTGCKTDDSSQEKIGKHHVEEKNEDKDTAEKKADESERQKAGSVDKGDGADPVKHDSPEVPYSENTATSSEESEPEVIDRQTESGSVKDWVVDKAGWTEIVEKTRTETRYRPTWWIKVNDSIFTYYSREEWMYARRKNREEGIQSSWGNGEDEPYTVEVPYIEKVEHPE